jgi:hypothetical protein
MTWWRDELVRLRDAWANFNSRRDRIPADIREELPLSDIEKVTFYKRDELTTDLICCDVVASGQTWFFHEEADGWDSLIDHLQRLPSWRSDWFAVVSQPPFARSETVAFSRQ